MWKIRYETMMKNYLKSYGNLFLFAKAKGGGEEEGEKGKIGGSY